MPNSHRFFLAPSICALLDASCPISPQNASRPSRAGSATIAAGNEKGLFNNGIFAFEFSTSTEDGNRWTTTIGSDADRVNLHRGSVSGGLNFGINNNPEKLDLRTWLSRQSYASDVKDIRDVSYNGEKHLVEFDGHVNNKCTPLLERRICRRCL